MTGKVVSRFFCGVEFGGVGSTSSPFCGNWARWGRIGVSGHQENRISGNWRISELGPRYWVPANDMRGSPLCSEDLRYATRDRQAGRQAGGRWKGEPLLFGEVVSLYPVEV